MNRSETLQRYYSLHASFYDLTRWSFLFGRRRLIQEIRRHCLPSRILEIGCGTGLNLLHLGHQFPHASLLGLDVSAPMLRIARRRLRHLGERAELREAYYQQAMGFQPAPDLICLAYSLSMIPTGFEDILRAVAADLAPNGWIAVVDFHASRHRWFQRWMGLNHVRMEGHLLQALQSRFHPTLRCIKTAYAGIWDYFLFLGQIVPHPRLVTRDPTTNTPCLPGFEHDEPRSEPLLP